MGEYQGVRVRQTDDGVPPVYGREVRDQEVANQKADDPDEGEIDSQRLLVSRKLQRVSIPSAISTWSVASLLAFP